jgi:hypothetical protein
MCTVVIRPAALWPIVKTATELELIVQDANYALLPVMTASDFHVFTGLLAEAFTPEPEVEHEVDPEAVQEVAEDPFPLALAEVCQKITQMHDAGLKNDLLTFRAINLDHFE